MALVTSLLLLVIITMLALSMFRSFGTQEKIAGNLREKERALHAAKSALQYAEWWLLQNNNTAAGAIACTAGSNARDPHLGQICSTRRDSWPAEIQQPCPRPGQGDLQPQNMVLVGQPLVADNPALLRYTYFLYRRSRRGLRTAGEAYQIDAFGYGSSQTTVAVVESTYEIRRASLTEVVCDEPQHLYRSSLARSWRWYFLLPRRRRPPSRRTSPRARPIPGTSLTARASPPAA